jgi:hypothetical protein
MEMFITPAEGNLEYFVELGDSRLVRDKQTAPKQRTDVAESQLEVDKTQASEQVTETRPEMNAPSNLPLSK